MQNFMREFLTHASHFGLHLDTDQPGPFTSVDGLTVARVTDLKDSYVLVLSGGYVVFLDGSAGMDNPTQWVSKVVETVDELADVIRARRAIQSGRWD